MSKTPASTFSRLDETDVQGFVLRGYKFPVARFMFLEISDAEKSRRLIEKLIRQITTGKRWDSGKPDCTVNIAFTFPGLVKLDLPDATLLSFPVEFAQGMKARGDILCDTGKNAPEHWDTIWREERVHAWLAIYAKSSQILEARCGELQKMIDESGGAGVIGAQNAAAIVLDGKPSSKEHFGYTDGFGNPDYLGLDRDTQPGQGKLMSDGLPSSTIAAAFCSPMTLAPSLS